jgi:hypothetical protein
LRVPFTDKLNLSVILLAVTSGIIGTLLTLGSVLALYSGLNVLGIIRVFQVYLVLVFNRFTYIHDFTSQMVFRVWPVWPPVFRSGKLFI